MQNGEKQPYRRYVSALSTISINTLNLKNPWLAVCWSISFPGFGHYYNGNYIFGMLLMIWEIIINGSAKINLCIFYTLIGDFQKAKEVINLNTFLIYGGVYIFCMWDSYRRAIEINKQYLLAYKNDENITSFKMTGMEVNFLEKKDPWLSALWTLITPGAYVIYLQKLPETIFAILWMGLVIFKSNVLEAVMYTFWGQFAIAKNALDLQWFLYLPSMYGYIVYIAYENAIEINRTFKYEQSSFLRKEYQSEDFIMPV